MLRGAYVEAGFEHVARKRILLLALLLAMCLPVGLSAADTSPRPKVRAITAFVTIDRARYQAQLGDTLRMLRAARAAFEKGGFEVQSIRIVTQPFPEYIRGISKDEALAFFRALDEFAQKEQFEPNLGPAMMHDSEDPASVELLGEILSTNKKLLGSVIVAADDGIHWKSLHATARMLKYVAEHSPRSQGNFNFAATAMLGPYTPFYPGAYHTGAGRRFAVATEGANVVEAVFAETGGDAHAATERLAQVLSEHARALEAIALRIEEQTGWTYMGLDSTPAPLKDVSIGAAIEKFTGAPFGSSGTMTAAAIITQALRALPGKRVGYNGLMVPILEDTRLAARWSEGKYNVDSLLAYSAVCGTGLDTVPLPGDVSAEQLERILGDMASLAFKWHKPLSARLLPVFGKKAGERTDFDDPFLENALIPPAP
jgi:uncharacterized protein (UPF0210 family)